MTTMTSHDTLRSLPPPPAGPSAPTELPTAPSAYTPRTAAKISRWRTIGAAIRRYYLSFVGLLGAAGLSLTSILKGIGVSDWIERWSFWMVFAVLVCSGVAAIWTTVRQLIGDTIAEIRLAAGQQVSILEAQAERQDAHHYEMIELIMERHAVAIGRVVESVEGLAGKVEALEQRMDATGKYQRLSTPPTGGSRG